MMFFSKKKEASAPPVIARKPPADPTAPHRRHNSGIDTSSLNAVVSSTTSQQASAAFRPNSPAVGSLPTLPNSSGGARSESNAYEPGLAPILFRTTKRESTNEDKRAGSCATFGSLKEFDIKGLSLPALKCVQVSQRRLTIHRTIAGDFGFSIRRVQYPIGTSAKGELKTVVFVEPTESRTGPPRPDDIHGLLPGDELIEVEDRPVSSLSREELQEVVRGCGDTINLMVRAVPELAEFCARGSMEGSGRDRGGSDALLLSSDVDTKSHEKIPVEARMWLLHKGGYTMARLCERLPDGRVVVAVAGREMTVDSTDVDRANSSSLDRVGDLTALKYINETSAVHLIRQRFHSGLSYTNAGCGSLISISGDEQTPTANTRLVNMFKGCRRAQMPAHIYATAQHIYRNMQHTSTSQSVLLTGVSGSGKSSQLRDLAYYFTAAAGWTKALTYDRLAASFGVLEAIGNAATHLNKDSTRFMLLLQLGFDKAAALKSARFSVSLLEAERVLSRPEAESSFHVFYYLWEGADPALRAKLRLETIETPAPLIKPLQKEEDRQKASEAWRRFLSALTELGASPAQLDGICAALGAIFHLARAEATACAAVKAHFLRVTHAQHAADLLGVSVEALTAAVFRGRGASLGGISAWAVTGSPSTLSRYSLSNRSLDGPDALRTFVGALYQELFQSIVELMNRTLAGATTLTSACTFVNLVDQPGSTFSSDWLNCGSKRRVSFGLSDLVYNYVNERIAEHFHDANFAELQELYAREQVDVKVEPPIGSPHPLNRLLDQKQQLLNSVDIERRAEERRGLLAIIEEESTFPGATDDSLVERIFVHLGDQSRLLRRGGTRLQFILSHGLSSAPTLYDATGWTRAAYPSEIAAAARPLLIGTKSQSINALFSPLITSAGSSGQPVDEKRLRRMTQTAQLDGGPRRVGGVVASGSLLAAVTANTDYVFSTLRRSARSHFIHCIQSSTGPTRSNSSSSSSSVASTSPSLSGGESIDVPFVRNQLRGTLLIDAIRASNRGFPERFSFRDFRRRFETLISTSHPELTGNGRVDLDSSYSDALDDRSGVQKILEKMDVHESRYALGISQVLLQSDVLADLEEKRELSLSGFIISFQRECRRHIASKWLQKRRVLEMAIRCIQNNGRTYMSVREWHWWRLYTRVLPLLTVSRADAEQREWEERLQKQEKQLNEMRMAKARLEGRVAELEEEVVRETATAAELSQALDRETQGRIHIERRLQAVDEDKRLSRVSSNVKMQCAVDEVAVLALRKELSAAKESETDLKVKTQRTVVQLQELQSEVASLRAVNATLEKKQNRFDAEHRSSQQGVDEQRKRAEKAERERDEAVASVARRTAEAKEVKEENFELRTTVAKLKREIDESTTVGSGGEDSETLKKVKRTLESKNQELEDELDDLSGQNQLLQQQVTRLEMNAERLRSDVKREVEAREAECEELRATYQRRLRAFEEQVADLSESNQSLSKQNRLLEARLRQHDVTQHSLEHSGSQYKRELRKALVLLADTEAILAHERDSNNSQALIKQLRQQLEDSEAAKLSAQKSRHGLESELAEIRTQLEQSLAGRKVAEERALTLLREKNAGLALIEEKDEQIQSLIKKYKAAVQQIHIEGIAVADYIEQIADLQKTKARLVDELNERSSQLEHLHQHTVEKHRLLLLEQKQRELQAKLELETAQRQRLESLLMKSNDEMDALNEHLVETATAKEREADQSKKARKEITVLSEQIEELRKRETELLHKNKAAKAEQEKMEEEGRRGQSEVKMLEKRCEAMRAALAQGIDEGLDEDSSDEESFTDTRSLRGAYSSTGIAVPSRLGARTVSRNTVASSKKDDEDEAATNGMSIL